jgi:hypothetical protein
MNKLEQSIKREANLRILWRRQKEKIKTLEEENKHLLKALKMVYRCIHEREEISLWDRDVVDDIKAAIKAAEESE